MTVLYVCFRATVVFKNNDQQNSYKVEATIALELVSNTYGDLDPLKYEHFVPHIGPLKGN